MVIEILEGESCAGSISFQSKEFTAIARLGWDGQVITEVKRLSRLKRFLLRHKHFPMPKIIRFIILSWSWWNILLLFFCLFLSWASDNSLAISFLFPGPHPTDGSRSPAIASLVALSIVCVCLAILYVSRVIKNIRIVAPWHGAEHMVLSAYEKTGEISLEKAMRESPVDDECGTRLILPVFIGMVVAFFASTKLVNVVDPLVMTLIVWEFILWIDSLWGWNKIPITSQTSRAIQKITTSRPSQKELTVALSALLRLVDAHELP